MSFLVLQNLALGYGKTAAVPDLNLQVEQGEIISLLGPSGCGKTTTMRAIAGLLAPSGGQILLQGRDITRLPPNKREIGLVFQSYALFPHLSAYDNVAFGLRLRGVAAAEVDRRTLAALASVGLQGFEDRLPARLSGGQQQRVAIARAVVVEPRLLLLDEPLSNLDTQLRGQMCAELRRIQRELGITMLYVTHDQGEALSLSDRIVILNQGRIEQFDTPQAIYHHPASAFVATFMGYDNLLPVQDGALVGPHGARLPVALQQPAAQLAWRPEQVPVQAASTQPGQSGQIDGQVLTRSYEGDSIRYSVQTALGVLHGCAPASAASWQEGDEVSLLLRASHAAHLPA